jgi:hypothetical protein
MPEGGVVSITVIPTGRGVGEVAVAAPPAHPDTTSVLSRIDVNARVVSTTS